MRSAKPKQKREIKINEPKEIKKYRKPQEEDLNLITIRTNILNIATVVEKHRDVWNREEDGYLNPYYKMLLGQVINLAKKIYDEHFHGKDNVNDDPFSKRQIAESIAKCYPAFGTEPMLTPDDKIQRLPAGFMGTLGSWARMAKDLDTTKFRKIMDKLGIMEDMDKLFDVTNKYMQMVYRDITWNELI